MINISQALAEVLTAEDGGLRVSQAAVEVLVVDGYSAPSALSSQLGVSQACVEVLIADDGHLDVSQSVVEVLLADADAVEEVVRTAHSIVVD